MPRDAKVVQYFGLSFEEPERIAKVRDRLDAKGWTEGVFPLFELTMERIDCAAFLATRGIIAPRSACVFCPFKTNSEWRRLRDTDPEGWARAVEVDEGMRTAEAACGKGFEQRLYLHRSCLPLAIAPIEERDGGLGFSVECEGMCGA